MQKKLMEMEMIFLFRWLVYLKYTQRRLEKVL